MATNTYVALDKVTISGSSTTTAQFLNISQAYTDLKIVYSGIGTGSVNMTMKFNNSSSSLYSWTRVFGNGSSPSSDRTGSTTSFDVTLGSMTDRQVIEVDILGYSNTVTYKSPIIRNSGTTYVGIQMGLYRSTSAISQIDFAVPSGIISAGTTFALYGIKSSTNSESSPKATGGYVSSDDSYYYHAFPYSGTFTPNQSLTCDILTIGGGGSGSGQYVGGGGGAGGVVYNSSASLSATGYTVTIGAGGAALATNVDGGTNGVNTTFSSITTAYGGGRGGYFSNNAGASGGSGGGGGNNSSVGSATQGTSSITFTAYGNAGGAGSTNASGGGGGAGAAGSAQTSGLYGGLGGLGLNTWASWMTATGLGANGYIANGASGANQNGYGIAPGNSTGGAGAQVSGQSATGSGGGGTREGGYKGNGGSGVVIVRYAK